MSYDSGGLSDHDNAMLDARHRREQREYIEELEADNKRIREERLAFATESEQRQSRIEAALKLADEFEKVGGEHGDIAAVWVVEELRETLGGSDE